MSNDFDYGDSDNTHSSKIEQGISSSFVYFKIQVFAPKIIQISGNVTVTNIITSRSVGLSNLTGLLTAKLNPQFDAGIHI